MRFKFSAAILAAVTVLQASAITINFDDVVPNNYHAIPSSYEGYSFNPGLLGVNLTHLGLAGTMPAHSGTTAINNNDGNSATITKADGGLFALSDLYIRSWYSYNQGPRSIEAYNGADLLYTIDFTLTSQWQQVLGNGQGISKLVVNGGKYFLLDDLTLTEPASAAVPESANSLMLMALSAGALAFFSRYTEKIA
jgi:hypothetical protein